MHLDMKTSLSNKFWARHLMDTVAMWLKCNSTPPFPGGLFRRLVLT